MQIQSQIFYYDNVKIIIQWDEWQDENVWSRRYI